MGNLCSRSSNEPDPFATPGRVLGASSTSNQPSRAPVPQKIDSKKKVRVGGPGRTLGGSGGGGGAEGGDNDARSAAAKAAEERAKKQSATSNTGKLSSQLAAQKSQTRAETLEQISREERGARDADAAAQARRWD